MSGQKDLRISLFGTPGAALNLGVGALRESTLVGILQRRPKATVTAFDDGWGVRPQQLVIGSSALQYNLCGVRHSRRYYRQESYVHMRLSARLGLRNRGLGIVAASSAIWDVSGGDSFADLYGRNRFETVTLPKELALRLGKPLILLPQTYGPFRDLRLRDRARSVVARSRAAWARDRDSYDALKQLLGDDFDPGRHLLGVDIAFALQPAVPGEQAAQRVRQAVAAAGPAPIAGLNVSGLLLNDPAASTRYGLRIDYRRVVETLAHELLQRGAHLILVPHVLGLAQLDSDEDVTEHLALELRTQYGERVHVAPRCLGAGGRKWLISQLDWFCGARMHSTIAGLSSGVPTASLAYSQKVRGVFASCGQEAQVADGRLMTTDSALGLLTNSFDSRDSVRSHLRRRLPAVLTQAAAQMDRLIMDSEASDQGGDD